MPSRKDEFNSAILFNEEVTKENIVGLKSRLLRANLVTVSELRDFVYKEVTDKYNYAQRPTARCENISNDFLIR